MSEANYSFNHLSSITWVTVFTATHTRHTIEGCYFYLHGGPTRRSASVLWIVVPSFTAFPTGPQTPRRPDHIAGSFFMNNIYHSLVDACHGLYCHNAVTKSTLETNVGCKVGCRNGKHAALGSN